jgi:hypothetical protein
MTLHRYLYCLNDPIDRVDLSGKMGMVAQAKLRTMDAKRGAVGLLIAGVLMLQIDNYNLSMTYIVEGFERGVDSLIGLGYATWELGESIIDNVFFASRSKQSQKHIDGAIKAINSHLIQMGDNFDPNKWDDDPNKDWLKHIRKHLRNIKKHAQKMKGKSKEKALEHIDDTVKKLQELVDKYGVEMDI